MPYTHEVNHIKLVGLQDRRRKLTEEQKTEIIRLRDEGWSLMKLAKEFEVSKKSILLIVNPESKAKNDKYVKDHWREFQLDNKVVDEGEYYFSIYQEGFWSEDRYEIEIIERAVH